MGRAAKRKVQQREEAARKAAELKETENQGKNYVFDIKPAAIGVRG